MKRLREKATPLRIGLASLVLFVVLLALAVAASVHASSWYSLVEEWGVDTTSIYDMGAYNIPSSCASASAVGAWNDIANRRDDDWVWNTGYVQLAEASPQTLHVGIALDAPMTIQSFGVSSRNADEGTSTHRETYIFCDSEGDHIASASHYSNKSAWYWYGPVTGGLEDVAYVGYSVNSDSTSGVDMGGFAIAGTAESGPFASYSGAEDVVFEEHWLADNVASYDFAPEPPPLCWQNSSTWSDFDEWTLWGDPTWNSETYISAPGSGTGAWQVVGFDLGSDYDLSAVGLQVQSTTNSTVSGRLLLCRSDNVNVSVPGGTRTFSNTLSRVHVQFEGAFSDVRYVYMAYQTAGTAWGWRWWGLGESVSPPTPTPTPTSIFETTPTPPETTPTPYIPNTPYPTATWPPGWPTPDPEATPGGDAPQFVVPIMPTNPPPTATPDVPDYNAPSPSQSGSGLAFGAPGELASVSLVPYDLGCPIQIPDTELGPGTTLCISYIYVKDIELLGMSVPLASAMTGVLVLFVIGWIIRR